MALILAIEPDPRQATQLRGLIQSRVGADLVLARTTQQALTAIGDRVPDLVLVPALLAPQDDAKLAAALRVIAAAAHVQVLTIPVLAAESHHPQPRGVLARWRRPRAEPPAPAGCDPDTFGDQIAAYLQEAAAQPAAEAPAVGDPPAIEATSVVEELRVVEEPQIVENPPVVEPSPAPTLEEPVAVEISLLQAMPAIDEIPLDVLKAIEEMSVVEESPAVEAAPSVEELRVIEGTSGIEEILVIEEVSVFEEPVADTDTVYELLVDDLNADDQPPSTVDDPTFDEPIAAAPSSEAAAIDLPAIEPSVQIELLALPTPDSFGSRSVWTTPDRVNAVPPDVAAPAREEREPAGTIVDDDQRLELWMALPFGVQRLWPEVEGVPLEISMPLAPGVVESDERRTDAGPASAPPAEPPPAVPVPAKPEWLELIESLRLDVERLQTERAATPAAAAAPSLAPQPAPRPIATAADITPPPKRVKRAKPTRPVQDEWGFFDPEQCGFAALLAKLDEISHGQDESAPPPG